MKRLTDAVWPRAFLALFLFCGAGVFSSAQENEDPALSGMSRQMRIAIRFYEKGDDLQAMDRFMDVLTKGDPAERQMANEYINLITHRMNTGERGPAPRRPGSVRSEDIEERPQEREQPVDDLAMVRPTTARPSAAPTRRPAADEELPAASKSLMKKEIRSKLNVWLNEGLEELRKHEDIRILMLSNGEPQAIAIPSPVLFQQGIAFQKDAGKLLDAITKIAFSLGGSQVVILPEGTAIADAKVLDMRRTMGISSHLFSAGVAPPRVRVNLLNTQVDIPKPLAEFKGIVILFVYNQPLSLTVDTPLGEEAGPPISLGVYPGVIRSDKGEGAVLEFSVQDPPAGLVSWRFQLLEPSEGGDKDLAPLQEVLGGSAVFHQIYWNGRRNYFGSMLAPGRYEAVLTATDGKNRQRSLHRWIQVAEAPGAFKSGAASAAPNPAAAAAKVKGKEIAKEDVSTERVTPGQQGGAPSADLDGGAEAPLIKGSTKPAKKAVRPAAKRPTKKAAAPVDEEGLGAPMEGEDAPMAEEPAPAPKAKASKPAAKAAKPADRSNFELDFNPDTYQLTKASEEILAEIPEALASYPAEIVKIQGFALPTEGKAPSLAENRAKMVSNLLINKYQIDPKRVRWVSTVSETAAHGAQVRFVRDE